MSGFFCEHCWKAKSGGTSRGEAKEMYRAGWLGTLLHGGKMPITCEPGSTFPSVSLQSTISVIRIVIPSYELSKLKEIML